MRGLVSCAWHGLAGARPIGHAPLVSQHPRRSVDVSGVPPSGKPIVSDCTQFVTSDEGCAMKKEMLINVLQPEESRIAIVEDDVLEELYVERISQGNLVGNIYKGRVVNIEPSIQAVFVDFGVGRNGFLHVSDVEYQYYKHLLSEDERNGNGRRGGRNGRFNERSARS